MALVVALADGVMSCCRVGSVDMLQQESFWECQIYSLYRLSAVLPKTTVPHVLSWFVMCGWTVWKRLTEMNRTVCWCLLEVISRVYEYSLMVCVPCPVAAAGSAVDYFCPMLAAQGSCCSLPLCKIINTWRSEQNFPQLLPPCLMLPLLPLSCWWWGYNSRNRCNF